MKLAHVFQVGFSLFAFSGCEGESYVEFEVTSLAFGEDEVIPNAHTCHGGGLSPPISFSLVPEEARGMVLVAEDLDYITGDFTHWTLYGMPAAVIIPEDIDENLPDGAVQGTADDEKTVGYLPPCAPKNDDYHRFRFTAYATDEVIRLHEGADRNTVDKALRGRVLGKGELTGRVPPKKEK